jgi:aminoglycoside phosphotransferase (APT) family kinase protein
MERIDGRVLEEAADAADLADPDRLALLGAALVDTLATVHAVDPAAVGLADLGRAEGYVERQVARWCGQWEGVRERPFAAVDELARRLATTVREGALDLRTPRPFLVHGDYNLGNVMVAPAGAAPTGPVIRAVLDWEMATLGHPLMDLALLLVYSGPHAADVRESRLPIVSLPGFPSRDQLSRRYAQVTGADLTPLAFFEVLASFKIVVLNETIRARFRAGELSDPRFAPVGRSSPSLAEAALAMADRSGIRALAS